MHQSNDRKSKYIQTIGGFCDFNLLKSMVVILSGAVQLLPSFSLSIPYLRSQGSHLLF